MSSTTFCFSVPLFKALLFHPRTDTKAMWNGSLGWTAVKRAAILYNQTVVVHWGQFTGRLVQGLALVAIDIRLQEIANGSRGQELTATTMRFRVDRDCNGKRIVYSSRAPQKIKRKKSEVTTSPLPSRGPTSGRKSYITPAFLGVPKKGDKIKSGYITPTFSGARKWAEMLYNPSIPGGPQQRGQNQKWIHNPCLGKIDS